MMAQWLEPTLLACELGVWRTEVDKGKEDNEADTYEMFTGKVVVY